MGTMKLREGWLTALLTNTAVPDDVTQSVVLLVQGEYRRVGDLGTCHTLLSRVTCHEAQPWCPAPAWSSSLRRTEGRTRMLAERSWPRPWLRRSVEASRNRRRAAPAEGGGTAEVGKAAKAGALWHITQHHTCAVCILWWCNTALDSRQLPRLERVTCQHESLPLFTFFNFCF